MEKSYHGNPVGIILLTNPLQTRRALESFNVGLRAQVELEQLTSQLAAVVDETMQPEKVSVWLRAPEQPGYGSAGESGA